MLTVFIRQRVGRLAPLAACLLACLLVFTTSLAAEPRQLSLRFDAPRLPDGLTLSAFGREPSPRLLFGHLRLLDGHRGQRNAVAFDAPDDTAYTRLDVACRFRMRRGPEGWSLLPWTLCATETGAQRRARLPRKPPTCQAASPWA